MKTLLFILICCAVARVGYGQNNRLTDRNALGWFVYVGDHKLAKNWALHTEYQLRRGDWLKTSQHQLARLGLVRTLSSRVQLSGGYTYFQSSRYGDHPSVPGRATPEHRFYEDVSLTDPLGRLVLTHRVRLEQRWLGKRAPEGGEPVEKWTYENRIRYQLSGTFPLQGPSIGDGEWYLNAFDELFMGFGRNVGENVFNQNRISGGVGYQFSPHAKLELNYLYQIVQHAGPDPASGRPVFESNQGFRLNVIYDLDFTHRAASTDANTLTVP